MLLMPWTTRMMMIVAWCIIRFLHCQQSHHCLHGINVHLASLLPM